MYIKFMTIALCSIVLKYIMQLIDNQSIITLIKFNLV